MDIDTFPLADFDWFEEDADDILETTSATEVSSPTDSYFRRSAGYWQQFPLPSDVISGGTNLLAALDDDTLLTMSPTLIAHVQRTEASGGLQVISPRMVTLGGLAARTAHTHRTNDMHIAGSAACRNTEWPVVQDPISEHLFWDEPIDSYPAEPAARGRTVSSGVLSSTKQIADPVTRAFLLGRALVDLQRRPDVAGSGDRLSTILAACWGVDPDTYEDIGEASLAPVGELLRYAIRSDDVYPMVNAPVQARKCITVGASTSGRSLYGENAAIDWRRLRVLAEAVFYQSSRTEGWTLTQMVTADPPGNPRAPPNRPGILQMRPLPGSVWTFDPRTFRLELADGGQVVVGVPVPERIRHAIADYHATARPIAVAAAAGAAVSFMRTQRASAEPEHGEAIIKGYQTLVSRAAAHDARGRTSAAAVRSFVYQCLADSMRLSSIRAVWLAKTMHDTVGALNMSNRMDVTLTRHFAARLSDVTTDMRMRLGTEAGQRGSDLETWWADLGAQLPLEIARMCEGSATWAMAAAHMLLHPPTDRWVKLVRAMAFRSHANLARGHLKDVRLPAVVGSAERTYEAARAVARQLGTSYGAFYTAVYDVACVLAAQLRRGGNRMGADKLMLAGLMWDIRAKAAASVTLHSPDGTSTIAGTIKGTHETYHITTAPYAAYTRWHQALNTAPYVPVSVKTQYPHHTTARLSHVFENKNSQLFSIPVGSSARLFRYAVNPGALHMDIERTLTEIRDDIKSVVDYYDTEDRPADVTAVVAPQLEIRPLAIDTSVYAAARGSYWDVLTQLDSAVASELADQVARLDNALASELELASYATTMELEEAVWSAVEGASRSRASKRDAVI